MLLPAIQSIGKVDFYTIKWLLVVEKEVRQLVILILRTWQMLIFPGILPDVGRGTILEPQSRGFWGFSNCEYLFLIIEVLWLTVPTRLKVSRILLQESSFISSTPSDPTLFSSGCLTMILTASLFCVPTSAEADDLGTRRMSQFPA